MSEKTYAMRLIEHQYGGKSIEDILHDLLLLMTQRDAAKELGVNQSTLSRWVYRLGI